VLVTVDESSYSGGTMGDGHPIAWCHDSLGGPAFYTALGHTVEAYARPAFRAHLAGGIRYCAGV
jgi:type 1 glutamine amidotransferase